MRQGPNGGGLSRKAIMTEIDAQPAPAGHRLRRPVPDPPLGPRTRRSRRRSRRCTTSSRPGKARYIGASSMWAWQFAKALYTADAQRLDAVRHACRTTTTCSTARRSGRCCRSARDEGDRRDPVEPAGPRPAHPRLGRARPRARETDEFGKTLYHADGDRQIVERGGRSRGGARRAAGAGRAGLAAAQAGGDRADRRHGQAGTPGRRDRRLALELTDDEVAALEEPYTPHSVVGFR